MKQKIYTLGIISAILITTGTIFKIQHWPAAAIILFSGTVLLLAAFLPSALVNHYRVNGNKQYKLLYITTYVTCFVVFTAMLFKILHLPYAGYLLFLAVPFPFVIFLPVWLTVTSRIKNFDINNTIYILFLLALQAIFSALLSLNVTKDKIDNSLLLTSQLSSFNAKLENLTDESDKTAIVSTANEVIAAIGECRQMLFNKTDITREGLNKRSSGERYLDSPNVAAALLIKPGEASPAMKLEATLRRFTGELQKLPGSRNLMSQANEIFDLSGIDTNQDDSWPKKMFLDNLAWVLVNLDGIENYTRVIKQALSD